MSTFCLGLRETEAGKANFHRLEEVETEVFHEGICVDNRRCPQRRLPDLDMGRGGGRRSNRGRQKVVLEAAVAAAVLVVDLVNVTAEETVEGAATQSLSSMFVHTIMYMVHVSQLGCRIKEQLTVRLLHSERI